MIQANVPPTGEVSQLSFERGATAIIESFLGYQERTWVYVPITTPEQRDTICQEINKLADSFIAAHEKSVKEAEAAHSTSSTTDTAPMNRGNAAIRAITKCWAKCWSRENDHRIPT